MALANQPRVSRSLSYNTPDGSGVLKGGGQFTLGGTLCTSAKCPGGVVCPSAEFRLEIIMPFFLLLFYSLILSQTLTMNAIIKKMK